MGSKTQFTSDARRWIIACRLRVMRHWCMMEHMHTPDLIGTAEAARLLGVSHRTIHRLVEAGEISATRAPGGQNGSFLFPRTDIEAVAQDRAASGTDLDGASSAPQPRPPSPRSPLGSR